MTNSYKSLKRECIFSTGRAMVLGMKVSQSTTLVQTEISQQLVGLPFNLVQTFKDIFTFLVIPWLFIWHLISSWRLHSLAGNFTVTTRLLEVTAPCQEIEALQKHNLHFFTLWTKWIKWDIMDQLVSFRGAGRWILFPLDRARLGAFVLSWDNV